MYIPSAPKYCLFSFQEPMTQRFAPGYLLRLASAGVSILTNNYMNISL